MSSSIKTVLASMFAVLAILSAVQGAVTYTQLKSSKRDVDSVAGAQLPALKAIRDISSAVLRIRSNQFRLVLSELDDKVIDVNATEIEREVAELEAARARYESLIQSPEEARLYRALSETCGIYLRLTEPLVKLMKAKKVEDAQQILLKPWLRVLYQSADNQLRNVVALNEARAREHWIASVDALNRAKLIALVSSVLAACLAFLAIVLSYFRILRPLGRVTQALHELSKGNTEARVVLPERRDEIGAMGRAVEVFRESLTRMRLAEAAQLQSRLFVQNVAASTPDGIIGFNEAGTVTFCNDAAESLFGFAPGAMLGTDIAGALPSLADLTLDAPRSDGARAGRTVETLITHESGGTIAVEMSYSHWQQDGRAMACVILRDIRTRKRDEAILHRLAHQDALTELPNRHVLTARIAAALEERQSFALLMLDLDHFKEVNDAFGHRAGDKILRIAARRLLGCVDAGDVVARIGGDEFIILLAGGADPLRVAAAADRVIRRLGDAFAVDGRTVHLGASVGIALAPTHGSDPDELMICADLALYAAKGEGRRTYRLFTPDLRGAALRDSACRQELPRAVQNEEFVLFYQPQVRLEDGALIGAEALIRWQHPERGLIAPDAFISVLESSHLAEDVGDWVIRTACRQAAQWRRLAPNFRVGVNLSGAHFRSGQLPTKVSAILAEFDLPGSALELEITERTILRHDENLVRPLRELQALGVGIAFDDYGTGYASLSLLKRFPLNRLKIDRSFVRSMAESSEDAAIVHAILQLGRSLDLQVIAEGVETEILRDKLRRAGCVEAQGFLFGRPMPASAFEALITQGPSLRLSA